MAASPQIAPHLSPQESAELAHIDYLLTELDALRARSLLPPDLYDVIVAEYQGRRERLVRGGRAAAALEVARRLAPQQPAEALIWAEQSRQLDPERPAAWTLAMDLLARLRRYDEALALAAEAALRFPAFQRKQLDLQRQKAQHDAALQRQAEQQRALQECGVRNAECGIGEPTSADAPSRSPLRTPHSHGPVPSAPSVSWADIAGEFLQEHWQKLLLCLAVLLIVVSSTVGARSLLGPLLWSPEGKCILALVYTLVIAAFGYSLRAWGAEGAGRMMLLTALIVVPVNFAFAGELQLLRHPSLSRLLVLALDAAALLLLSGRILEGVEPRWAGRLVPAFFALSALPAVIAGSLSPGWGFAALVLTAGLFLAGVWGIHAGLTEETFAKRRGAVYLGLGLLAYAFLFGFLRSGLFILNLLPTLYALPVMLLAIACVHTAHNLLRCGEEAQRAYLMRYAGHLLAGAAFALALARPPEPSPLFSGNTLATALLGLSLFAASLRLYRQPVYLYCAFAALFVAYFGAGYFIGDVVTAIEDTARRALGYEHRLPTPFKSLNGIVFNVLLALLALQFARRWKDARLTRHCHAIGLPLAMAACVYSTFEPKAAALCLPAYAALFALGAWLFAQPLLAYLACAAFAGATFFAATLLPAMPLGAQALGAAGIGFTFWTVCAVLASRRVAEAYRAPLVHAALAMSAVAVWAATLSVLPPQPVSSAAALTFFAVGMLAMLLGTAYPRSSLAYLTVITANIGYLLAVIYAGHRTSLHVHPLPAALAVASGALSLLLHLGGTRLAPSHRSESKSKSKSKTEPDGRSLVTLQTAPSYSYSYSYSYSPSGARVSLYREPLLQAAFVMVGVTWLLGAAAWSSYPLIAAALTLTALTLAAATRLYPVVPLAHLATASALGVWLSALEIAVGGAAAAPAVYGVAVATFGLSLLGAAEWARRLSPTRAEIGNAVSTFAAALPDFALGTLLAAVGLAGARLTNGPAVILTLTLAAVGLMVLTRFRRHIGLVYLSLAGAVAAALCCTAWSVGWSDPDAGVQWLALTAAIASLALWSVGHVCRRRGGDAFYAQPPLVSSLVLTVAAAVLGLQSPAVMLLAAVAFLLMVKSFPAAEWLYASLGAAGCAVYFAFFSGPPDQRLVIASVAAAFGLWGLGTGVQRLKPVLCARLQLRELGYEFPLFNSALVAAALAILLRIGGSLWHGHAWTAHVVLLPVLALFALLMLRPYPWRGWVHLSVGLITLSLALKAAPFLAAAAGRDGLSLGWLPVGMASAGLWLLIQRGLEPVEAVLCRRLGVRKDRYSEVPGAWSLGLFAVSAAAITGVVVTTVKSAVFGPLPAGGAGGWGSLLLALAFAAAYLLSHARALGPELLRTSLYGVSLLGVWWLGAPVSPLTTGPGVSASVYYPLATGCAALAAVLIGARRKGEALLPIGLALTAASLVFTKGFVALPTVLTLLLATATFAVVTVWRQRVAAARAGGAAFVAAFLYAMLMIAGLPSAASLDPASGVALGALVPAFLLLGLASWLRRTSHRERHLETTETTPDPNTQARAA